MADTAYVPGPRFLARVEEYAFLTEVYGWSHKDVCRQIGERQACRYRAWLRDHPEAGQPATAVYDLQEAS